MLFLCFGAAKFIAEAQQPKLISIGQISKIDSKGKSITIQSPGDSRFRRGGGRGGPGPSASQGPSGAGGGQTPTGNAANMTQSKIVITSATTFKEGDNSLKIEDFKIGDRVQVVAIKKGRDLQASDIIRMKQAPK
jgi:hypothetical protein